MSNTISMVDNLTQVLETQIEKNRILLKNNTVFNGEHDSYEIYSQRIGMGGESQVHLAKRLSDGKQVVAKIYDEYADTPLSRRNRRKIISFLTENSDYKKTHIMPLLDYGTIQMESNDDELFSKPVDIIPYCNEGTLKSCDYNLLRKKIIPELLSALHLMHTSNLVHRDIKPSNIYMLNDEVVIADFGTAGEISDDKFDYVGTQRKRGTVGYTAPEVWQGYAVIASDFYSLGCTIASLYKGEHVYQRLMNSSKKDDALVTRAINTKGLPLDCSESEADLQVLVNSLVETDELKRSGYDEVMLWINDPVTFSKNIVPREIGDFFFKFENVKCTNITELTNAMLKNWEMAKRYLYRGGEKNSAIVSFFSSKNPFLSVKAIDIIEGRETAVNQDLGLARFLHFLNISDGEITCPIYWKGAVYAKPSDLASAISNKTADEQSIIAMLQDKFLTWKFDNTEDEKNENTIKEIKYIEEMAAIYPQLGYYYFMYKFTPKTDNQAKTPDDIFLESTKSNKEWYENARKMLNNDETFAFLISTGFKNNVLNLKKNLTGKFITPGSGSDLALLYQFFEAVCENKTAVREHYLLNGPQSYLYWIKQNLDIYSFNSSKAQETKQQISNIVINKNMNIADICKAFSSLEEFLKDFMMQFQNNVLLSFMGIFDGKDVNGITATNVDAFIVEDFFGIPVPVGFRREIGID